MRGKREDQGPKASTTGLPRWLLQNHPGSAAAVNVHAVNLAGGHLHPVPTNRRRQVRPGDHLGLHMRRRYHRP